MDYIKMAKINVDYFYPYCDSFTLSHQEYIHKLDLRIIQQQCK
jgi:hypothetical protein